MASNQETRNQYGARPTEQGTHSTEQDKLTPAEDKQATVAKMGQKAPQHYSAIANITEANMMLANSLYTGHSRTPDIVIAKQPSLDDLGLEATDRNIEFCKRQRWMYHFSADTDGTMKLEGFQIKVVGDAKEFQRTYEDLTGHPVFNGKEVGTYNIGIADNDSFNNVELDNRTGVAVRRSVEYSNVVLSKGFFNQTKFERIPTEKATIHLEMLQDSLDNGVSMPRVKGYLTNVHGGPVEIDARAAEIYMYGDKGNIGALQGRLREEGYQVDSLHQQVGKISAFEAVQAVNDVIKSANCDTSVFTSPGTTHIDKHGYLREDATIAGKALQDAANKNIEAYDAARELVRTHTVNNERYNPADIIEVKRNINSTCDRALATDKFKDASTENVRDFTTVLAEERIKECEAKDIQLAKSYSPTKKLDSFIANEVKAEQEAVVKYNTALKEFDKLELIPIADSKEKERQISDRHEILKELGFSDPDKISTMSRTEVMIQMDNLQKTLIKVSPSDEQSLGSEENMKKAENISRTLQCLQDIVDSHPENFRQDYKSIHIYGSHDKLPVSQGTVSAIETLQVGASTIPQIRDITVEDLASKEKCAALRADLQKVMDEKTHFVEHNSDGTMSRKATYQSIIESINVKEHFAGEDGKIDLSKITPESLREFSKEVSSEFSPNEMITVNEVVRLKLCQEVLSQQEHSMDYRLDRGMVDMMRDEATKAEVLKYMGEHHSEIKDVLLSSRQAGLSREDTLSAVEKHLSLNCNVTVEDMNRIRDSQNDFFKQELFQEVMVNGAPEGMKFASIKSMCGIKDFEQDLQSPEKCQQIYRKLDETAEHLEGVTTSRSGTSRFINQGQLSFVEHMRDNMGTYIAENNLQQAESQKISYEYDSKAHIKVQYTQEELAILDKYSSSQVPEFKENMSDPYAVYLQAKHLQNVKELMIDPTQEQIESLKAEKMRIEEQISELKQQPTTDEISAQLDSLKKELRETDFSISISENYMTKLEESSGVKMLPILEDKINSQEFAYPKDAETSSQKEQVEIIAEKEALIQHIIDNYQEGVKIEKLIDEYYPDEKKGSIMFRTDQEAFFEKIQSIDWSEYQKDENGNAAKTYTPISQLDVPFDNETKTSPIKLEIMSRLAVEQNGELASLVQPEITEYVRQGDRSIAQEIFAENMRQAYISNPQVDISDFQEYQSLERTRVATDLSRDLVSISVNEEKTEYSWNIENCTKREVLKEVSSEELKAARDAELEKATAEIRTIIYGTEKSDEPSISQISKELKTVNPTAYGTQSIETMIDTRATTASTIYHLEQQLEDTAQQKFTTDIERIRALEKDHATIEDINAEIDKIAEKIDGLEKEDNAKSSWARRLQGNNEREIESLQSEIDKLDKSLDEFAEKYHTTKDKLLTDIDTEIKAISDYETKLDTLTEKYTSKLDNVIFEREAALQRTEEELRQNPPSNGTEISPEVAKNVELQLAALQELKDLQSKPFATWNEEDVSLYTRKVDKTLSTQEGIASDIELAKDYQTYILQGKLLDSLRDLESTRDAYGFTAHEIQSNNYVLVGHEMDARQVYPDYETKQALRTLISGQELSDEDKIKLDTKYHRVETMHSIIKGEPVKEDSLKDMSTGELRVLVDFMKDKIDSYAELEKDTEKTFRLNPENGNAKETLSAAIRLIEMHQTYETVVNAYNTSLSENIAIHTSSAKAEAFEAETRESISDRMYGASEVGTIATTPQPIVIEPLSPSFEAYVSQMEDSPEYKEVMQALNNERVTGYERTADKVESATSTLEPERERETEKVEELTEEEQAKLLQPAQVNAMEMQ